jgi:hypothetical protein
MLLHDAFPEKLLTHSVKSIKAWDNEHTNMLEERRITDATLWWHAGNDQFS